jgi:ParB family chromosome partitioning protein
MADTPAGKAEHVAAPEVAVATEPKHGKTETREFRDIAVAAIDVGTARRALDQKAVIKLAQSIDQNGLLQAPVVRPNPNAPGRYFLVAGAHRVAAIRLLGRTSIQCRVLPLDDTAARIAEIDENVFRKNPTAVELAALLKERSDIHEKQHGKAKSRGANAANLAMGRVANANLAETFSADVSAAVGMSKRAIQRAVQRAKKLGAQNMLKLKGTSLDQGNEIDALLQSSPKMRVVLIERAAKGEAVSAVAVLERSKKSQPKHLVRRANKSSNPRSRIRLSELKGGWKRANEKVRGDFAAWLRVSEPALFAAPLPQQGETKSQTAKQQR